MTAAKDLSKEAPASPRLRTRGYAILSRMADKGRAEIAGTLGDYHFDCPLDKALFEFKGVKVEDVRAVIAEGSNDLEVAGWFDSHGKSKSTADINNWSDKMEKSMPFEDPEMKDWFVGVCAEVGIDPEASSLFDFLEADDRRSFPGV
ncbi:MAG: DUF5069 domain-containing protein [Verrucomicrobia bacterium]|nr:MAG: DUF5069 domain-containing protein [Verrucomicrobiota bacterium]TAE87843.1 MAG: DUF5069 domain-containing protein [Verrucomicrobiota bacterium]TAF25586.1 MAG: DUF5069 domain-containing protein [Verrucomicrobiota bacterium]TAF41347.1 MAG: DUF5069 domain-containing protein [Verrucomicrobiota bacterium]